MFNFAIVQPAGQMALSSIRTVAFALGAVAFMLGASSGLAGADDQTVPSDFTKRVYINAGLGVTKLEPDSPTDALTVSDSSDAGGHLGVGFDLNRLLSIEAYIADLGTADIDFLGTPAGTIDYQVFGVSLLGYLFNSRSGFVLGDSAENGLFRREGLSLYGRAGIGHMRNAATNVDYVRDHPSHAAFGLGLEYGFRNGVAIRTELMGFDTDAKYLNVGLLKRFGDVPQPVALAVVPPVIVKAPDSLQDKSLAKPLVPPYVYFEFDKSDLSEEAQGKLDEFATAIKLTNLDFIVEGHTDWIAPEKYNMSLSIRRAEAVTNYLTGKGVASTSMTTMGYGETRPISTNNTANGRALNRRVELNIQ